MSKKEFGGLFRCCGIMPLVSETIKTGLRNRRRGEK